MNGLQFAQDKVSFDESSPITGKFDSRKYRMLEKPLLALDNIAIKRLTCYKASSALGTVYLQIAISYWLDQRPGSIQCAMQSDDDATDWMKTRGKKWLSRIPSLKDSMSNDKHAMTNSLWLWPYQFLLFTGPGENAQQAKQVTHFVSDESHVDAFAEGALASFEERMSKRWNRCSLHVSTAANEGKEVDRFYYMGGQNEFHLRCTKCDNLVWPLWEEDAQSKYNGERIFVPLNDRVIFTCPHCQAVFDDTSRDRFALHENADYVTMNASHLEENESFRWNCFSAHWIPWIEQLNKYREAIEAAKLGNLQPHENFIKKRLCQSYTPTLPNFGEQHGETNYAIGDKWEQPDLTRILTADYQAGKKAEGSHLWALCTEWDAQGNSRRVDYRRLDTWAQLRAMQTELGVLDYLPEIKPSKSNPNGQKGRDARVYVDSGYDDRTVYYQCGKYGWYATQGSNLQQYHTIIADKGTKEERPITIPMPYSQPERANGNVGAKQPDKLRTNLRGNLPLGWCLKVVIGNEQVYGYLHALQSGVAGRYFGIARDIPETYTNGFPAFIPVIEKDKKTNVEKLHWRKVKVFEHPWDTECMALIGAMRAGCYPLKSDEPETKIEIAA